MVTIRLVVGLKGVGEKVQKMFYQCYNQTSSRVERNKRSK
ncbi:MAG: hypothetical protein BAJATHORv1_30515 [Candidatus Thorarchaeota archaeon]|nr:MAG: hypothetical protein BAJATHORv1_30515 [Candidatus Thorarchaeota archaeon]